jgi:ribonuclease HI
VGEPPLPRLISVPEGYTTAATDGSCIKSGNDGWGPGGWAYVTEDGRNESKAAQRSTNNRMELLAVYYLLKSHPCESFLILSDSEYVIGVLTGQNKVKANEDIVRRIRELMTAGRSVRFKEGCRSLEGARPSAQRRGRPTGPDRRQACRAADCVSLGGPRCGTESARVCRMLWPRRSETRPACSPADRQHIPASDLRPVDGRNQGVERSSSGPSAEARTD